MGTCKYCGKSAGLFSNKHSECEDKHKEGLAVLTRSLNEYFDSNLSFVELKSRIEDLRIHFFVSDEDLIRATQTYLHGLSVSMKRQNSASIYQHLKEFINGIGIRYDILNSNSVLDTLGEKFVRYHLVSYFAAGTPLQKVKLIADRIATEFHLRPEQVEQTHIEVHCCPLKVVDVVKS